MGLFSFAFAWTGASSFHPVRYIGEEMDKMPTKPKKPCRHPGCPKLTDGIYCEEHGLLHCSDRTSSARRGYNRRWRIARSRFLKTHLLCVRCRKQGRLVKATVVDHIVPHRGDDRLFWNEENWQALCKNCHDSKTMTEDRYQEYKY
nr:MAG TPA: HNH endonuclease [Caudoviricetes sp.]